MLLPAVKCSRLKQWKDAVIYVLLLFILFFGGEVLWKCVGPRIFRKKATPRVRAALVTTRCPWCASQGLAWDNRFSPTRPELIFHAEGDTTPDPEFILLLHCNACGRDSAFDLYSDFSMRAIRGCKRGGVWRRCLECGYDFNGAADATCPQCNVFNSVELDPRSKKTCLVCGEENDGHASTCSECLIPFEDQKSV